MAFATDHPFPLAHMFFFKLADRSPATIHAFVDACVKYLSKHPGQTYFSVGLRAVEMRRDVNATNFDVAMHMVFRNVAAYKKYEASKRHDTFITVTAGISNSRVVYDSYLVPQRATLAVKRRRS
jgi:hypothetical protein